MHGKPRYKNRAFEDCSGRLKCIGGTGEVNISVNLESLIGFGGNGPFIGVPN